MFRTSGFKLPAALLSLLTGMSMGIGFAQINEIDGANDFTPESVLFEFSRLPEGASAAQILSRWGVGFAGVDSGVPVLRQVFIIGFSNTFVENAHPSGSSANRALVIDFRYPIARFGCSLENAGQAGAVQLQAFDPEGNLVGQLDKAGLADGGFLGFETANPKGVAKVTVSYGDSENPEQLDNLHIDYQLRPEYISYLAQVADGPIGGGSFFQTTILISNLTNSTAEGQLQFYSSDGQPLALDFNGVTASSFQISIPPLSAQNFQSSGQTQPVGVGYARVAANVPVEGSAVFRIVDASGKALSEVGISTASPSYTATGAVQKREQGQFNSGIAVVNTSGLQASGILEIYDSEGDLQGTNVAILSLGPGNHTARFLDQLFPDLQGKDFEGTIYAVSDQPLAIVIIRTVGGKILTGLPVGSVED